MIKIIFISEIINVPSFITAGSITHDLIYEMVYLYAKFLELLIHRLGLGGLNVWSYGYPSVSTWFLT